MAGRRPRDTRRVTQRAAADRLGVSAKSIMRYVADGLIPRGDDDLIDFEDARRIVEARRDRVPLSALKAGAAADPAPPDDEDDASGDADYDKEHARKERALATRAELDLAERQGALVDRATRDRNEFERARVTRDRLLTIPDALCAELAATREPHAVRARLDSAIRSAIAALVEAGRTDRRCPACGAYVLAEIRTADTGTPPGEHPDSRRSGAETSVVAVVGTDREGGAS
jgi:hypothetical protein